MADYKLASDFMPNEVPDGQWWLKLLKRYPESGVSTTIAKYPYSVQWKSQLDRPKGVVVMTPLYPCHTSHRDMSVIGKCPVCEVGTMHAFIFEKRTGQTEFELTHIWACDTCSLAAAPSKIPKPRIGAYENAVRTGGVERKSEPKSKKKGKR